MISYRLKNLNDIHVFNDQDISTEISTPVGLAGDGVTLNDVLDVGIGPNNLQNFPVINGNKAQPRGYLKIYFQLTLVDISALL